MRLPEGIRDPTDTHRVSLNKPRDDCSSSSSCLPNVSSIVMRWVETVEGSITSSTGYTPSPLQT